VILKAFFLSCMKLTTLAVCESHTQCKHLASLFDRRFRSILRSYFYEVVATRQVLSEEIADEMENETGDVSFMEGYET